MAISNKPQQVGLSDPNLIRQTETKLAQSALIAKGKPTVIGDTAVLPSTTVSATSTSVTTTTSANNQVADTTTVYQTNGTVYVSSIDQTVQTVVNKNIVNQIGVTEINAGNNITIVSSDGNGAGIVTVTAVLPTYGNIAVVNLDGNGANVLHGNGYWSPDANSSAVGTSGQVQINWVGTFSNQGGTPGDTYSTLQFDGNGMPTLDGTDAYQQRVDYSPYMQILAPRVESTDFSIVAGPALTLVGYDDTYNTPRSAYLSLQDQATATQQWDVGILGNGNNNFVISDRTNSNQWTFGSTGNLTVPGAITTTGNITGGNVSTGIITLTNGAVLKDTATYAVAFGKDAGLTSQGQEAVAVGHYAGRTSQGNGGVAIGVVAGNSSQGQDAVAVGSGAGRTNQGSTAVAIGSNAGATNQGNNSIIINATGSALNQTTANTFTVSPVRNDTSNIAEVMLYNTTSKEVTYGNTISVAGNITGGNLMGPLANGNSNVRIATANGNVTITAVGNTTMTISGTGANITGTANISGNTNVGNLSTSRITLTNGAVIKDEVLGAISFGANAGFNLQKRYAIAFGANAGSDTQGNSSVALGAFAGSLTQGLFSVAIGDSAGYNTQSNSAVAIGGSAGQITQGNAAIAIGTQAGYNSQSANAVAIGFNTGNTSQGNNSVAIGDFAGATTQGNNSVAVGRIAGQITQGQAAVAIGYGAGYTGQGNVAVAIGSLAGSTNQGNNSIIINATGAGLEQTVDNTFTVAPVRNDVSNIAQVMLYNTTSKEVTYGNTISVAGNITGGNLMGPLANGNSNVRIAIANGNVTLTAVGNTTMTISGTGANITGTANVTGNANVGNIGANNGVFTGNISGNTAGFAIGYLNIPQVAAANATIALTDAGKHYYSTSAGNFTLTVPNNTTTSFATGTAISIVVQSTGNVLVNAASGVTLYMAGNSTAANRVVSNYGMATIMKVATDTWMINGTGVA